MPPIHPLLRSVLRAPAGFPPLDPRLLAMAAFAGVAAGWFAADLSMVRRVLAGGEGIALPATVVALAVLAGRVAGWVAEALAHALAWRALGRRLPVAAFLAWLPVISTCDLIAHALIRDATASDWLFGPAPHAVRGAAASGFEVAFGGFGLFALLRLALTARVQCRALGAGWAGPLAVTGSLWLASRLTVWWGLDLIRGASPL